MKAVSEEIRYMNATASTPTDAKGNNFKLNSQTFPVRPDILSANPDGSDLGSKCAADGSH